MRGILVFALLLLGSIAMAQPGYYEVADVPTDLDGTTYLPWQIVENLGGSYNAVHSLPDSVPVDAVYRRGNGNWLLSVASATELGGTMWAPQDVFETDGTNYIAFFDGAAAGVPSGSNVDAAFLLDSGDLVVSFDVPTTIAASTYVPADLVVYSGESFALFFNSGAAAIPAGSDVSAADHRGGLTRLSLDIPTTVGSDTFLPGEVVSWNGSTLALDDAQPAWPANRASQVHGLSAFPSPGGLPSPITLGKLSATHLRIQWSASDCAGGDEYGIYAGAIGSWDSHQQIDCTDDGTDLAEDLPIAGGDKYYLVVPHNFVHEGSYGTDSSMTERAVGSSTCAPSQLLGCNP